MKKKEPLKSEEFAEFCRWAKANSELFPEEKLEVLQKVLELGEKAFIEFSKHRACVKNLRTLLHVIPSSEKRKHGYSSEKKKPDEDNLDEASKKSRNAVSNYRRKKNRRDKENSPEMKTNEEPGHPTDNEIMTLGDIGVDFSDKLGVECDETFKARVEAAKLKCDDEGFRFQVPSSTLFSSGILCSVSSKISLYVDQDWSFNRNEQPRYTRTKTSTRIDLEVILTEVTVERETVECPTTGKRVTASVDEIGPKGFQVTWMTVVTAIILSIQYFFPFNRLSSLVDGRISPSRFYRIVRMAATRILPIYKELIRVASEADIYNIDDTPSRVLDVSAWLNREKVADEDSPPEAPPWENRKSPLIRETVDLLGYRFKRANDESRKVGIYTSVVVARYRNPEEQCPCVVYRSHIGSAGNFMEKILEERRTAKRDLVITSDMLSANKIRDPKILDRFNIRYSGDLSHARRPFARYREDDPELCDDILEAASNIAEVDRVLIPGLKLDRETAEDYRKHTKVSWASIGLTCKMALRKWTPKTPIGQGLRYILKHFWTLTYPTDDLDVDITNNIAERALRAEKLMKRNSLFNKSVTGRVVMDIHRSIIMSCHCAGANPKEYYLWFLKQPQESVEEHPEKYTPHAFLAKK